jgi:outer membrane immunogenic protein
MLHRLSIASISLIAGLALTQITSAADLPRKAPAYSPAVYSWTGCYIGANVGAHWDRDRATTTADPIGWSAAGAAAINATSDGTVTPSGVIVGGQVGCNWQANGFLIGIEGDARWLSGDASRSVTNFPAINSNDVFTTRAENRFVATLRPRLGMVWDRWLLFVTGGLAVGDPRFTDAFGAFGNTSIASISASRTRVGWTVGGGVEYAFSNNWSAKFEYLYADFGTIDTVIPSCIDCAVGSDIAVHHKYTENVVRAGLNYKFW